MASEIRAGVRLNLNDQFSPGIKRAGASVQGFRDAAVGAAEKANRAFSGLTGTLATVGVGIGAAALVREGVGFQDAVTRIATSANAFGDEAGKFGERLLQAAYDARVSSQELIAFASAAADGAVGLEDIAENMPLMADLIQGVGISGAEAGRLLSLFFNRGADADSLREKLNNVVEIGARLGNVPIPDFLRYLPSMLEAAGNAGLDGLEDTFIAVNMLRMGTDRATQAAYQYRAAMRDFANPDAREAILRHVRFDVGDADAGELRGFAEIMGALSEFAETRNNGSLENFGRAFHLSDATIRALAMYNNHFENTMRNVGELGDTSDAITRRAAQNAGTIQGSLNQLRTAATEFANDTLMRPIEWLANLLSQHPDGMRRAVIGLAAALTAMAGMKAFNTVVAFINNFKSLKGGGGGLGGGLGGGAGIPVRVTNMGSGMGMGMDEFDGGRRGKRRRRGRGRRGRMRAPPRPRPRARPPKRAPAARAAPPATGPGIAPPRAAPSPKAAAARPNIAPPPSAAAPGGAAIASGAGRTIAAKSGAASALIVAPFAVMDARAELAEIARDETLSDRERGEARGGAIGDAAGTVVGAAAGGAAGIAAGAAIGAAVGSVVPGLGTAVGALVGAGVGALGMWLGGRAGRAAGAAIGGALAGDDGPEDVFYAALGPRPAGAALDAECAALAKQRAALLGKDARDEMRSLGRAAGEIPPVTVDGEIVLRSELVIDDGEYRLRQAVGKNTTPYKFSVGSSAEARMAQ